LAIALELGGAKQQAVLAALLLRAGKVVPIERVVDDVWGAGPPPSAEHSPAVYVSRLRHALAPHGVSLERRAGGYRLRLGGTTLDAQVFEGLVADASEAAAGGEHARAAALARQALGLWRGPVASCAAAP
jgi:DNA-binding SARP family transcriptional activator